MIWVLIYILTVLISSVLIYKNRDGFLFFFVVALAFIAPYSDITGLSLYDVFVRLILPGIVMTYVVWKYSDLKSFLLFSFNEFLKYTFMIFGVCIFIFIYDIFIMHIQFSNIPINYYVKYFELFWSILFFLILFARLDGDRRKKVFNNIHFIILIISSLIGFLTYLRIPFVREFHEKMYNYIFILYGGERELFDFVRWYNRPYSIFSAANQFGLFASLSLIASIYFYDESIISRRKLIISIVLQLFILISSQSRTGFIFYLLITGLLFFKRTTFRKKIVLIPIIIPIVFLIIIILPERIVGVFSGQEGLIEMLGAQRIFFWIKFINSLSWDSIINGMPILQERGFESGYFNVYSEGGIALLLLHFTHLIKIGRFRFKESNISRFAFLYALVFILSELLQGSFVTTRYVMFNGMIIAYLIIKKFEKISNEGDDDVEVKDTVD